MKDIENIKENNLLISNFLGYDTINKELLEFNTSLDLCIPIINKMKEIEDDYIFDYHINFKLDFINGVELYIGTDRIFLQTAFGENQLLNAIYNACVEFIRYYNNKIKNEK